MIFLPILEQFLVGDYNVFFVWQQTHTESIQSQRSLYFCVSAPTEFRRPCRTRVEVPEQISAEQRCFRDFINFSADQRCFRMG